MTLGAVILAGGESSRFGSPKADAVVGGRRLVEHAIDAVRSHCSEVVVVARPDRMKPLADTVGVTVVGDAGEGPLPATLAGLAALTTDDVIVLACDMPFAALAVAALAAARPGAWVAIAGGARANPLCARYPRQRAHEAAADLVGGGRSRMSELADALSATPIAVPADALVNVNRPEDLPVRRPSTSVRVVAVNADGDSNERPDSVVTEEPLEIRVECPGRQPPTAIAVTMRTPGNDFDLAAGFLVSEGLLADPSAVHTIRYCRLEEDEAQRYNIVTAVLRAPVDVGSLARRNSAMTSSCGVCGKATLDELDLRCAPVESDLAIDAAVLAELPGRLRTRQRVFDATGGLHAAGLARADGMLELAREDVGRHNAVDKVIGAAFLDRGLPLRDRVLVVSGRLGFEIVQKAAVAGIPVVASVSAPSSLAIETAERFGVTLAGFVRGGTFNLYCGASRVSMVTTAL